MRGRRDENEAEIVSALHEAGCDIDYAERKPYDVLVGRAGMCFALEIKAKKGRLQQSQEDFRRTWRGHYAIVRTVAEALKAVGL